MPAAITLERGDLRPVSAFWTLVLNRRIEVAQRALHE